MATTPAEAWESYAAQAKPRREVNGMGARTWLNWTQYPDHGPDESVLGPIHGKRVVELGSGTGANLAHLATLGAQCVGVDIAPTRTARARRAWGHLPTLLFETVDAVDHLRAHQGRYDVVYSIFGAVWFTDPGVLLPLVHRALAPGGVLAFSHLPASGAQRTDTGLITKHNLSLGEWEALLRRTGFAADRCEVIPAPSVGRVGTLLVRATRA